MSAGPDTPPQLDVDEVLASDSSRWIGRARAIGASREDRPILGFSAGTGPARVTLIGGCHADEPVGPATLELLASHLAGLSGDHPLARDFEWRIVPHVNPDGEARNRAWTGRQVAVRNHRGHLDQGFELSSYLASVSRELPGDDIEFGFPSVPSGGTADAGSGTSPEAWPVRPENRAVADFLAAELDPPRTLCLHGSFHGMGLAPGPWFLLEPSWIERTGAIRARVGARVEAMGYRLFDAERHGEKGFHRIEPGFATRPDSRAMRAFFEARDEAAEAAKFRPSSMEFAGTLGDDPLTFVTEMPLFLTPSLAAGPVERDELEAIRSRLTSAVAAGLSALEATASELGVAPMPIRDQMRLQLTFLHEALRAIARHERPKLTG